jgi:A/G-specific adenine glycosylase
VHAGIPQAKAKTNYEAVREAAVVVRRGGKLLLRQCGPEERWAGMWDFLRFPIQGCSGAALRRELAEKVFSIAGISIEVGRRVAMLKHGVTRFRITLLCHEARCLGGLSRGREFRWVAPAELEHLPLSVTGRELSRRLSRAASD